MSGNEPLDPFQDPDRTVLVPAPGGKRAAPPAGPASAPAEDRTVMAPAAAPAVSTPAPAARAPAPAKIPATLHGAALNPLVRAANPLLDLVTPLRHMTSYPNVEELRVQLIGAIKTFETEAKAAQVPHEAIAAARYSLCTFLDETISSTPWGGGGVWASRSLLVTFHNEAFGGEKFFLILQKLGQDARANLHILELMYLCLALGLEGRYRVIEGGRAQLEILRERLQQLIQKQRGAFETELSVHWKGATGKGEPLWRVIPVWVLAAIAAVVLIIVQLFFSYRLNQASDPVFAGLHQIKVQAPLPPAQPAPAPVAAKPVRVAGFLAPEIERGLVSVNETADRSVVTLRGDGVFASGSAEVTRDFIPLLQRIGDALKPVPGKVIVIGHTDNVKGGISAKFPSNWDLSKGRAESVRKLLAERAGPPDRYTVEGRGDTEPLVPNDSAANRARNRRVDIIVLTPPVQP
ncbi:DotU family type VI secretion system protein [Undibacterium sp. TJN25]|uniref:DotU family type VI secretion system protein n=1 Tax=Undibacterium sp. TJN25 TaxID=3413056 RepID=UPI003BF15B08